MGVSPQRREKYQRQGWFCEKASTQKAAADAQTKAQRERQARQPISEQFKTKTGGRKINLPPIFLLKKLHIPSNIRFA
jgi:hypothetical protein